MRTFFLSSLFLLLLFAGANAQNTAVKTASTPEKPFRILKNRTFAKGEKLTYLAHYGFIHAGRGVVSLDNMTYYKNGRPCYKVDIEGKTTGMFAVGMKVNDTWRSYIDMEAIMPHEFYRNISENKFTLEETSLFDHKRGTVKVKRNRKGVIKDLAYNVPTYTQDMVSGYYYLRTLDFEQYKAGDIIKMDAFFEDELYVFQVKYLGKEVIKTRFGKLNAFKLSPIMPENSVFNGKDAVQFWISDDPNRVPLMVKVNMFIGAFEIELVEHQGLAHSFSWAK
jgi:hypothetical protein